MNSFYEHHKDSIRFHYRCFDRILLNGLIQPFQQPESVVGFFNTYRQLYPVSRDTLRGIADHFQQWLKSWSAKRNIPVLEAPKGRRDEFVEPYFKGAEPDQVVAVLKAREPARIMIAIGERAAIAGICNSPSAGSFNTTSISMTRDGAACSCACAPTFRSRRGSASTSIIGSPTGCARRASTSGNAANAFMGCADPERLQELADELTPHDLVSCGQKWLACFTPFFTAAEREEAGCQHRLFFAQTEFCDNLIFHRRAALDKLGERLLDANRTIGQPNKITTIFGRKVSKRYRGKLQTEIENMDLAQSGHPQPLPQRIHQTVRARSSHPAHRGRDQQRHRLRRQESHRQPARAAQHAVGHQRQLPQRPAGHPRNLHRPRAIAKAGAADDHRNRKTHSRPQARQSAAARPHACPRALRHIAAANTFTTAELYPQVSTPSARAPITTPSLPCATICRNCAPRGSSKSCRTRAAIGSSPTATRSASSS